MAADIGFVGPLIMLALVMLTLRGHLRMALCWGGGMLLGLAAVLIIKRSMTHDPDWWHFPSGHVALAVTFYGGLALLLVRDELRATPWRPLLFLAILGVIALAEGISRVALTEHGWMDVVGGFAVGVGGLTAAGNTWAWETTGRIDRLWVAGSLIVALPFSWLLHPHVNPWIRHLAGV
ncbi:MAG: phosphatase PAP2 family protein [Enhydrobacter sp.]|nr:phosphatase PAP2 family protein [Enhydrobacter sp.]